MLNAVFVLSWSERLALAYFATLNTAYLVFLIVAFFSLLAYRRRNRGADLDVVLTESLYRPISILVPAHNERETIAASIRSLLNLDYPEFEIVVVNDGSTDDTMDILRDTFDLLLVPSNIRVRIPTKPFKAVYRSLNHPNLLVIDKERGGKADALNAAINASCCPVFCSIDADSLLESTALRRVARAFVEDEAVIAAGGIVRVVNGSKVEDGRITIIKTSRRPMVLCQTVEYLRGFLVGRTVFGRFNSLLIISGAFSLFQKEAVIAAGGYNTSTVAEDMEIVVRLHRRERGRGRPRRLVFAPDPVCWTQVPEDWRSLLRQRDRWQRGLLQTLWVHRQMMGNPRYGVVGLFALPFCLIFEAVGPVVEAVSYLLVPALWFMGRLDTSFAISFVVLAVFYGILLTLLTLILDDFVFRRYERPADLARLMAAAIVECLGFRQLLALRRCVSLISVFLKKDDWGKPQRKAIHPTGKAAVAIRGPQ